MTADRSRVLAELALPLAPGAGLLDALGIAVAVEDALDVTLPDEALDVATMSERHSIESVLKATESTS